MFFRLPSTQNAHFTSKTYVKVCISKYYFSKHLPCSIGLYMNAMNVHTMLSHSISTLFKTMHHSPCFKLPNTQSTPDSRRDVFGAG